MQKNLCPRSNLEEKGKLLSALHNTRKEVQQQEIAISIPQETEIQDTLEHLQQQQQEHQTGQPVQATQSPEQHPSPSSTPLVTSGIEENADWPNVLKDPSEGCQGAETGTSATQIPPAPHSTPTRPKDQQALALTPQMRVLTWILETQGDLNCGLDPLISDGSKQLVTEPESNHGVERDILTHDDLPLGATAGTYRIKQTDSDMISITSHLVSTPNLNRQIIPCRPNMIVTQEEAIRLYPTNKGEEGMKSHVPTYKELSQHVKETLTPIQPLNLKLRR